MYARLQFSSYQGSQAFILLSVSRDDLGLHVIQQAASLGQLRLKLRSRIRLFGALLHIVLAFSTIKIDQFSQCRGFQVGIWARCAILDVILDGTFSLERVHR